MTQEKSLSALSTSDLSATWDLTTIIPKGQSPESLLDEIKQDLTKFETIKQHLIPTITEDKFKEILTQNENFSKKITRLGCYISLLLAANLQDKDARALDSKLNSFRIELADKTRFFGRWLKGLETINNQTLDDTNATRIFKASPDHTFQLTKTREAKKHTLTENEEKIIHRKDATGIETVTELYDLITNDFTYTLTYKTKDKDNKEETITTVIENQGELLSHVHSDNPSIRKAAYDALFTEYKKHSDKFYLIYSSIAKDWSEEAKLRSHKNSIAVRNFANKVPGEAVNTLLEVCKDNITLFQDFFKLKAKLLKGQNKIQTDKLTRYDLYAPMPSSPKDKISFEEAKQIVLTNFKEFSQSFHDKAKEILDKGHLDSHPRKNKRSGAFCMSVTPQITPYVLTNYDGTARDVSTLAHELGHGIHDLYAASKPHSVMHPPLPLAETASTFGEMIVFEALLKRANSSDERHALIMDKLASSYATIIRQNYFVLFEITAHNLLMNGASEDELCEAYMQTLKEQFGDSIEIPEDFKYEWSYIPHIYHSPFYCYAYNFGELLSLALYQRYKQQKQAGKDFVPMIEKVLSAGGSQNPTELLKSIDIDINDKEFWQGGFTIIKEWISQVQE
mgnify:CR=1 FL=1